MELTDVELEFLRDLLFEEEKEFKEKWNIKEVRMI